MTNAELLAKIKSEIERLYAEHSSKYGTDEAGLVLYRLEDFLDSLEPEKPSEGLEEEIIRFNMVNRPINHSELGLKQWGEMVARHFAQWGAEHLKK